MNSFYTYKMDLSPSHQNILVCYIASFGFDLTKFTEIVKRAFDRSPFSRELIIITAGYNQDELVSKLLSNSEAIRQLKKNINNYQILNIHAGFIKESGDLEFRCAKDPQDKGIFSLELLHEEVLEAGLIDIMVNRDLVMKASPNFHFVKPSGMHSDRFIKASNVLEKGAEISFLAINLLRITGSAIQNIYTDTAGIYPLAYELLAISHRFSGKPSPFFVDSFGGYKGLETYQFSGDDNSLVIISASTSDRLSQKLANVVGLSGVNIVSIFTASTADKSNSLVSFKRYSKKYPHDIFEIIKSKNGYECDMCIHEKSTPLSLSNSNFVFDAPESVQYLPVAEDSSMKLKNLISSYKDSCVFKCLYDGLKGSTNTSPEYFIDVSELVKNNQDYQTKLKNKIIRTFPLSADVIVHANDQGAIDVAEYIKKEVKLLGKEVYLSNIEDIEVSPPKAGIVVVAGSIQSGKSLLDISRKLRKYSKYPITYIVGFTKYNDMASYLKLKNDLKFNNGNPSLGKHEFISIDEIMLPLIEHRVNSWERELEVLKVLKTIPINTTESLSALTERERFLREAGEETCEGIGDSIFMPSLSGGSMKLGPTFAFWNEKDTKDPYAHQATVYFTISSILQGLRYKSARHVQAPLGKGYVLNQIDPLLFDRFNEGVIHASILRSSKPSELDFSADDSNSRIVGSLIEKMIKEPDQPTSEALPEFLLALCTKKLQIKDDHITNIKGLTLDSNKYPMAWILLEYTNLCLFNKPIDDLSGNSIKVTIPF
ncbi:MAG: hypothetical protein RPS47_05280 [Colwellia sp.]|jgi:hypothetical protein